MNEHERLITLVRRGFPQHESDWQTLVQTRVEQLRPHLESIGQSMLGDVRLRAGLFGGHPLQGTAPVAPLVIQHDVPEGLRVRGVFPESVMLCASLEPPFGWIPEASRGEHCKNRCADQKLLRYYARFWAFTTQGTWLGIHAEVAYRAPLYRCTHCWVEESHMHRVTITRCADVGELCQKYDLSARDIYTRLSDVVKGWLAEARLRAATAEAVAGAVAREESVLWTLYSSHPRD